MLIRKNPFSGHRPSDRFGTWFKDVSRIVRVAGTIVIVVLMAAVFPRNESAAEFKPSPRDSNASVESSVAGEAYHLPGDKLAQARVLGRVRTAIHFGAEIWELAVLTLLLTTRIIARLAQQVEARTRREWLHALLFSAGLIAILFFAAELPVVAIGHFVSLRYSISVQGWVPWAIDQAKTLGLEIILAVPALMLLYGLINWTWSRKRYWIWFWAGSVPATMLGAFLLPQIIEPMFDNFEPLSRSHPGLVAELEKVVARTGTEIPPDRMFLMKASQKSNGLNAYVSGIGSSKRIVVWDTTADRMPADEILFIFGHESGHYVLNHIVKGLVAGWIGIFFLFGLTAWLSEWMVRKWGVGWRVKNVSALSGLAVIVLAFTLLEALTEPAGNAVSRLIEHQADVYGQEAVHGIVPDPTQTAVSAFNHLGAAYLEDPEVNPLIAFWTYDHPSIQSRATFAAHYDPWEADAKPKYFSK